MTTEALKSYVKLVYDLERDVYEQEQIIDGTEQKIGTLGHPTVPTSPYNAITGEFLMKLIPVFAVAIIWGWMCYVNIQWMGVMDVLKPFLVIEGICIIVAVCMIAPKLKANENANKKYQQEKFQYELTLSRENSEKAALEAQLFTLRARLEKSKALRQRAYDCNVIYPKYQNLVAVSSFYDYLMAGRCFSLGEQPSSPNHGAYNIYEEEVRLDKIIFQLDRIQRNQYMLYQAVKDVGNRVDRLLKSADSAFLQMSAQLDAANARLDTANRLAEFSAYEAEQARKELEYQNRMNRLTIWKDID